VACNRLDELEIVVFALIGGPHSLASVSSFVSQWDSNALSGLVADMLAPMRRRAKSFLSGKCPITNLPLAVW
jgi:hypothetical protein